MLAAIAVGSLIGWNGCSSKGDGAVGTGTAGTGGGVGGTDGAAGTGGGGTAGTTGGLPPCAIATRPDDPVNTDAGAATDCNTLVFGADFVSLERFTAVDGGAFVDAGAQEYPLGGIILNGDYDLVRFRSNLFDYPSRRSIRIFDGATFIEWLFQNKTASGMVDYRFNMTAQPAATDIAMLTLICGAVAVPARSAYTVSGNDFLLFNYASNGTLQDVHTYRRTCSR